MGGAAPRTFMAPANASERKLLGVRQGGQRGLAGAETRIPTHVWYAVMATDPRIKRRGTPISRAALR